MLFFVRKLGFRQSLASLTMKPAYRLGSRSLVPALRALGRIAGDEGNLKEAEEYLSSAVAECRDLAEARSLRFDRAVMSFSAIAPVRQQAVLLAAQGPPEDPEVTESARACSYYLS